MSSRNRLREWPRLLIAVGALAVLLVLLGVVVASASTGNGQPAQVRHLRATVSRQAGRLRADSATITRLRAQLTADRARLAQRRGTTTATTPSAALVKARRAARCWKNKALHPKKAKKRTCSAGG